jgi:uncharacterized protein
MSSEVINNEREHRYELALDGGTALALYRLQGDLIAFNHTEVPPALEGKGVGSRLIAGALADVRERGLKVLPHCSFVKHYIEQHPDSQDLLAD